MRCHGIGLRWRSLASLLALSSATLSTVPVRADIFVPLTTPPPSPSGAAVVSPPSRPQPIELREVFWGGRYGELRHRQVPFQGGKVLEGAEFYRALDREDLARAYEARVAGLAALAGAGLLTMLVSASILVSTMPQTHCDIVSMPYPYSPPQQACTTDSHDTARAVGVGLMLLGPALMLGSFAIHPDPVSPAERQALVDTYNASLGPPTGEAAPVHAPRSGFNLSVEPTVSATGGGVAFGGRF